MSRAAELLADLIAWDTRNPGGNERAFAAHLGERLSAFSPDSLEVREVGERHGYVLARFGAEPTILLNAHIDTVPINAGWTQKPLEARTAAGRLHGLGACDTKGAIAAALAALEAVRPRSMALLFSGDEEHSGSCVRALLATGALRTFTRAVVCEPTALKVGIRHRGVMAFRASVRGAGGHSSRADHMPKPVVEMARLAVALDAWGQTQLGAGPPGFLGMCVNVADLRGGVAFNVVPDEAELTWSVRPPPGFDTKALEPMFRKMLPPKATLETVLDNAPFATRTPEAFIPLLGQTARTPVDLDFWTEAAVLSQAGIDAVVYGPGDIAQAHAPDEFVETAQLERACQTFTEMFRGSV